MLKCNCQKQKYGIVQIQTFYSCVRSKPRITLDPTQSGYFYPRTHQPISIHPLVEALGRNAVENLLIQSLYRYANDIAIIETRIVNHTILQVISNQLPIKFNEHQILSLYTIMTDEAYHAYVAYDAMLQIQKFTNIKPLSMPNTIEIEIAINNVKNILPKQDHLVFELIAVCIAENTLTKEIITMIDKDETHPFFQTLIKDHLSDERRHSGIFYDILSYTWENISNNSRKNINQVLPKFIQDYLGLSLRVKFDKEILRYIGLNSKQSELVINDTYNNFKVSKNHPLLKNIISIIQKSGMLNGEYSKPFVKENWL